MDLRGPVHANRLRRVGDGAEELVLGILPFTWAHQQSKLLAGGNQDFVIRSMLCPNVDVGQCAADRGVVMPQYILRENDIGK